MIRDPQTPLIAGEPDNGSQKERAQGRAYLRRCNSTNGQVGGELPTISVSAMRLAITLATNPHISTLTSQQDTTPECWNSLPRTSRLAALLHTARRRMLKCPPWCCYRRIGGLPPLRRSNSTGATPSLLHLPPPEILRRRRRGQGCATIGGSGNELPDRGGKEF